MASTKAHHATGWAAGAIAATLVTQAHAGGPYHMLTLLALLLGIIGGTAPDWLEVAWWSTRHRLWIKHRTWTHWGVAWVGLMLYSYSQLGKEAWAPALLGFTAGGIMHLLADWPNPVGIPWIYGRHSLKLWKSGNCDFIVIFCAWLAAASLADYVFFNHVGYSYVKVHLMALTKVIWASLSTILA